MAGFYGSNIINDNFNNYQFEKIYPNRKSMDDNTLSDDVSLNGYVLIEYTYGEEGTTNKDEVYKKNAQIDLDNYNGQNFDNTIWIKKMTNDGLKYLNIGIVNTTIPKFELRIDSPMELNSSDQGPYFDADSTDLVQYLHVQAPWRFELGNIELNEAGFNPDTSAYSKEKNQIYLTTSRTPETEYANDPNKEGEKNPDDTQVLNIKLPIIGNTISKVWDIVYGEDRKSPPESLQGRLNSFNNIKANTLLSKDTNNAFVGIGTQNDNWINSNIDDEGLHINHNKANTELMKSIVNFGFGKMGFDDAGHMVAISSTNLILDCGTASN